MLTRIKDEIVPTLSKLTQLNELDIQNALEVPKSLEHGHLAFPVFPLAKSLRKAPPLIAKELAEKIRAEGLREVSSVEPAGGYVNFKFNNKFVQQILTTSVQIEPIGFSKAFQGKTFIIDYSSPNVAKKMHVGHLRTTVIGQAVRNLAESQGYKIIGINHLGDWGVQFGKLAWAYVHWKDQYDFQSKAFDSLYEMYVRFHDEAEKDPELEKKGAAYFKKLEEGDPEIKKIWKMFLDVSLKEYDRLYKLLNVKHELVQGEAFYNDLLEPTVKRLEQAGLLKESEGAQVVFMDEPLPPCIIKKSDGASLYATRDIASAIYRREVLKGDEIVYVVGIDQNLHFQQVFQVLKKLGYAWAENCHHVATGMYRFKDGKMSSRKGQVIFMDDLLFKGIDMVRDIIKEKNPTLSAEEQDTVSRQVGVGAIVFHDLVNDRIRNVEFDWETVLSFEGNSGPYVQYCVVRCKSLAKKYGKPVAAEMSVELKEEQERELVRLLLNYDDILKNAFRMYKPNILAQYLLDVCQAFNHFYHACRILGEPADVEASRMVLVDTTRRVLEAGLKILGIQAPEVM
jgi:arginyl-tRNA synthetase